MRLIGIEEAFFGAWLSPGPKDDRAALSFEEIAPSVALVMDEAINLI